MYLLKFLSYTYKEEEYENIAIFQLSRVFLPYLATLSTLNVGDGQRHVQFLRVCFSQEMSYQREGIE